MSHETPNWTFVRAKHYKPFPGPGRRTVRVLVIHDMEAPESSKTAENVARYFATTSTPASAHICIDNDRIIQCVKDNDIAYAAPGCNSDGIQIELAGYANQGAAGWADAYSKLLLERAADATSEYCLKYNIPPVHLTNAQLGAGARGIIGHYQASQVYKKSDHMDPGPTFPWESFILRVATLVGRKCADA
jgi:N-acetyl-anhydromuramyl-L-alanine amidase AmpD